MKVFFLSVLSLCFSASLYAQERQYSTTDKQAIKYFAIANQNLDDHMYDDAVANLKKAISEDSKFIEAHAVLADILRQEWNYKEAIGQYRQVISLSPDFNRSIYYKLGDSELHE